MHQLAIALKRKGYVVTGSDDEIFEPARSNLEQEGLLPSAMGWFPDNIHKSLNAIILGMHAKADNPELQQAEKLGLTIYSFPEAPKHAPHGVCHARHIGLVKTTKYVVY